MFTLVSCFVGLIAPPVCYVGLTCEDQYNLVDANLQANLKKYNISMSGWGTYIEMCIDYVQTCGCQEPYMEGKYHNLCVAKSDICFPPCKCDGLDGPMMHVSVAHISRIIIAKKENKRLSI